MCLNIVPEIAKILEEIQNGSFHRFLSWVYEYVPVQLILQDFFHQEATKTELLLVLLH